MKSLLLSMAALSALVFPAGRADAATADAIASATAPATADPAAEAARGPVVVELFTSQGCSSCPPADAFLAELAEREEVLALSFHVDYWNRLGWTDPFATAWNTRRQQTYQKAFGLPYVYTPQIVVDGAGQAIGSDRRAVLGLIGQRRGQPAAVGLRFERVEGNRARVLLPETAGAGGRLMLFGYDREHRTEVKAGENGGRRLSNVNVVTVVEDWGSWSGEAVDRVRALPAENPGRAYALVLTPKDESVGMRVLGSAHLLPRAGRQ